MKLFNSVLFSLFLLSSSFCHGQQKAAAVPAPLFVDPNYHGSCDPKIIFNPHVHLWYIYYTARRAMQQNTSVRTPIGVISSKDFMHWQFRGYCKFDGIGGTPDAPATFWTPGLIRYGNKLHMFVTWKLDTTTLRGPFGGPGIIHHYEAPLDDPVNGWTLVGAMTDTTMRALDPTVRKIDGLFYLWFKAKKKASPQYGLFLMVSKDMIHWEDKGFNQSDVFNKSVTGSSFEEAPYVFRWKGWFWLITDPHRGLFEYRSKDANHWKFQGTILRKGGTRKLDNSMGRHCSVEIVDDRAFIVYHVEPWREYFSSTPIYRQPFKNRETALQMAELKYKDGEITCDRNAQIRVP